ncbi:hypothetical protein FQN55_005617 [Onygenales sp. PD_40]|nr:hypothetical protein FQN55_005617 [Onygenales sp. PD_40]
MGTLRVKHSQSPQETATVKSTLLEISFHCSSDEGVSSVSTLIVSEKGAILIDAPLLISDAEALVKWIREKTRVPVKAVFVTHHHEDHYFSAHVILDAFPGARFYAALRVCAGIEREYEHKVKFWREKAGSKEVAEAPRKPSPFESTFFVLEGNLDSPIVLLGLVQGDTVDVTLYGLRKERTIVCGNAVHGRSTHVCEKVTYAEIQSSVDELYETFMKAFPRATKHTDFLVYHGLANQFGKGGKIWEENKHHNVAGRSQEELEEYIL